MSARSSSTVSNSLASSTHSSVRSGKHLVLRFLHDHAERRVFARAVAEAFGQRRGELEDRAGPRAAELLVELGHDHVGADAVEEVGGGETFDRLAVDRARDVDGRVRVVDERVFGVGEVGEAVAEAVDLVVDRFVADRLDRQLDAQLVVTDEVHLRAHLDDGFELDVAVVLTGGDLDLGRRDHVDVVLGDRVDVELGQRVAERLLARDVGADAALRAGGGAPCPDGTPGLALLEPACLKAASIACSNSSAGTVMWSLTLLPSTDSTVLCIRRRQCIEARFGTRLPVRPSP